MKIETYGGFLTCKGMEILNLPPFAGILAEINPLNTIDVELKPRNLAAFLEGRDHIKCSFFKSDSLFRLLS